MGLEVANYKDLKDAIKSYLNRDEDELVDRIETFIALSERKLFRQLRCPSNERLVSISGTGPITLPVDYLEAKVIMCDGVPLERVTDLTLLQSQAAAPAPGTPKQFARIGNLLQVWPMPDEVKNYVLYYWADLSGDLEDDADTNEILRIAPDIYIYGALLEAEPWLRNDNRIEIWMQMFTGALGLINDQRDQAEMSGSIVSVKGVYGD